MNELGSIALIVGLMIAVIAVTKAVWQWVLGTNILIEESRQQTKLLEQLVILAKQSNAEISSLSKEEKAKIIDDQSSK